MNKILATPVKFALVTSLILLLSLVSAAAILLGLASSESGTRFLAGQVQRWSGGLVSWQAISGSLGGPLRLEGVRVTKPGMKLEAQSLALDWRPWELLQGTLQIEALEATGIRIALSETESSAPTGDPLTPGKLKPPINVTLRGVRLRDLLLVQGGQPAAEIEQINLDARLKQGQLFLERLKVCLPRGGLTLSGNTTLADDMPVTLLAAWDWHLPEPDSNASPRGIPAKEIPLSGELALQGRLNWHDAIEVELHYQANTEGLEGLSPDLPTQADLSGTLRGQYQGEALQLGQLNLVLAGTPLELALKGQLSEIGANEPLINATLEWVGLQWPLLKNAPTVRSTNGELRLTGSVASYDLELAADLAGTSLPVSDWQGRGTGDLSQIRLHQLKGGLLGGSLGITGMLVWDPVPRWELQMEGSDLDPGYLAQELPGQLAAKLQVTGQLDPDRGLAAELRLEELTGKLLDYPLNLNVQARLADNAMKLDSLELDSGGNRLVASGAVSSELLALDWRLRAPAPGVLLPDAAGVLTARGVVEGSPQTPRLQAQLQGERLRFGELTVTTVEAALKAGMAADDALTLNFTTGPIRRGDQNLLESSQLRTRGTTASHRLDLELVAGYGQVQAGLEGGLDTELTAWQGQLARLIARSEQYGRWRLVEPAVLSLSRTEVVLGNSCLQDELDAARVCVVADWAQAGDSRIKATLGSVPLEQWVSVITGDMDGEVNATLGSDGTLLSNGSLRLSPGQINVELEQGVKQLAHGGGDLSLTIDAEGLATRLRFAAPERGRVAADVQLPALTALPPAEPQALRGQLQVALPELSGLAAWVPELAATAGQLEADLALSGTLDQPELQGELSLTNGAADIPLAGLQLRRITLKVVSDPARSGLLEITGGVLSDPGRLDLSGRLDLPGKALALNFTGERLLIYNTRDVRALLSPDLRVGWSDGILKLRGRLIIPEAAITPRLALSPAAAVMNPEATAAPGQPIAPSPDVIVLNAQRDPEKDQPPQAPFRIDSQVQLVLGDQVDLRAFGLISRVSGAVTFINTPEQAELLPVANGRLSLEDGTFRAFGQNLDIETGQLIFANAPVTEPELNVRAFRWIDNDPQVTAAGVVVTGPVTEPALVLISRPQLEASEILSYLLTGRPAGDRENVLSIGTYLHPKLYVGYGYNLLEQTNEFNTFYALTPRYGMSINVGEFDNNLNLTFTHER